MRPIKFRIWNKDSKNIEEVNGIDFHFKKVATYPNNGNIEFKNCELMQFTGVLDKNGKEIYEGDVIKYDGIYYDVHWADDFAQFDLIPVFEISPGYLGNALEFLPDMEGIEIVGNLYENNEFITD